MTPPPPDPTGPTADPTTNTTGTDPTNNDTPAPILPPLNVTTTNLPEPPESNTTGDTDSSVHGDDNTNAEPTRTTFRTTIRSIVRDLAANNVLPPTWPVLKGFPSISESIWNTGSLAQCIHGKNSVVTVLLILGAEQNKLHAVNIAGPTHPQFLTFDKHEARSPIPLLKPAMVKITSLAKEIERDNNTSAKLFLQPHGRAEKSVPRIMPLPANLLHHYLQGGHPAELLIAIKNDPATTVPVRNHNVCQWLQHACLATDTDGTQSALHITPNTTVECNPDIMAQIISDLEDGLHDDAEHLITALQTAKVIPASDVDALQRQPPPAQQPPIRATHPALRAPPPHQAATSPPAFAPPPQLFDLTRSPPPPAHRPRPPHHYPGLNPFETGNHYTGTAWAGHQGPPGTAPPQHAFPPFGPPPPPYAAPQFFQAPPMLTPFPNHYAPPQAHPGIHDDIGARLRTLLAKDHLTTEDMNRLQVLNACQDYNKTTPPATTKSALNLRAFFVLGWANVPLDRRDILDQANAGVWSHYDAATTKAGRMDVIDTYMIPQLTSMNPRLTTCLHHDWKSAIEALDLAPRSHATGRVKCGLGPLAYVARSMEQIQTADMQLTLNREASCVTADDIERTKSGTPIIPPTVDGVLNVLECQVLVLQFLFGPYCPLARGIRLCIAKLHKAHSTLANTANFRWTIGAEILWQITKATTEFFDHKATEADVQARRLPSADLQWLADAIDRGCVICSTRPAMFTKPLLTTPKRSDRDRRGRDHDREGGKDRSPNAPAKRTKVTPDYTGPHTRQLPTECQALLTGYTGTRFPPMSTARKAATVDNDADLASALGVAAGECLTYAMYGKCAWRSCRRQHTTAQTSKAHHSILDKTFRDHAAGK